VLRRPKLSKIEAVAPKEEEEEEEEQEQEEQEEQEEEGEEEEEEEGEEEEDLHFNILKYITIFNIFSCSCSCITGLIMTDIRGGN
jgi:negative regulator of genetic competence, sporulation and motility